MLFRKKKKVCFCFVLKKIFWLSDCEKKDSGFLSEENKKKILRKKKKKRHPAGAQAPPESENAEHMLFSQKLGTHCLGLHRPEHRYPDES